MQKKLIVYFSHDGEAYVGGKITALKVGNTKAAAELLQALTGAELFRLVPQKPYPDTYRNTVDIAKTELHAGARPAFEGSVPVEEYDVVFLCYPNWWNTFPMIAATFLESFDFTGKTILPLCTHEGSGMGVSEKDLQKLCPAAHIRPGLAISGGKVAGAKPLIERWLKENESVIG